MCCLCADNLLFTFAYKASVFSGYPVKINISWSKADSEKTLQFVAIIKKIKQKIVNLHC